MITDSKITELIEYLTGTPNGLSKGCEIFGIEMDNLSDSNLLEIDTSIFWCEICDWCLCRDEESGEQNVCQQCHDNE